MVGYVGLAIWLVVWSGQSSQGPPRVGNQGPERLVQESVDALAARARLWTGSLHQSSADAFRRWLLAARSWQAQTRQSPESLLAEGVLFDCLARMTGLRTGFTTGSAVDRRFQDLGRSDPAGRARVLFEQALKVAPNLVEARFRAARIRAAKEEIAKQELERLAHSESEGEIPYLAAVTLGSLEHDHGDERAAQGWYERALALRPSSVAARVGLATLNPATSEVLPLLLDQRDSFYDYPCRVMTQEISIELQKRLAETQVR